MDVIQAENVKIPNSVIVTGVIGDDSEIVEHLTHFGSVERVIDVPSITGKDRTTIIVEFKTGEPIQQLQNELPCKTPSRRPDVIYDTQLLSEWYTANRSSSLTDSYLADLKGVAKLSGTDFEKVLLEELAKIQKSTKSSTTETEPAVINQEKQPASSTAQTEQMNSDKQTPINIGTDSTDSHDHDSLPSAVGAEASSLHRKRALYLPPEQLTTPEVQKVVVEHIIKSNEMSSQWHSHSKLRSFSGKSPCPQYESDYDTWRSNVEFQLTDATVSDKHAVRRIVESLLPPAANIVKHLGSKSTPHDYLHLLDSAYGTVDDGDELYAKFLHINQDLAEKPSAYLQRLQTALSKVVKRGGIITTDSERQLLKQFCRGCWNNDLITNLQLEHKIKLDPPPFSELLLMLRTEEDRQAAKSSRMKQHLGIRQTKAQSNSLRVEDYDTNDTDTAGGASPLNAQKLEKQLAQLQSQMASLKAAIDKGSNQASAKPNKKPKSTAKASTEEKGSSTDGPKVSKKPRPWYCFSCGEDGHIAPSCPNEANPELVAVKRTEFKQKLKAWEQKQTTLN